MRVLFGAWGKPFDVDRHLAQYPSARVLVWYSCGAASAVASKLCVHRYGDRCEVLYCDTLAHEHEDNARFMRDCETWIGRQIKILRSTEYRDIYDVFERTRYLVGNDGARCTTELKKNVRKRYQRHEDVHVIGFTVDELSRAANFQLQNIELFAQFELIEADVTKAQCYRAINQAGIELPAMYRLGYRNNNCIGCVKGGAGYWNKIRRDFPPVFERMAQLERRLDVAINKRERRDPATGKRVRERVFLDQLDPSVGRYNEEADIECGVMCVVPQDKV